MTDERTKITYDSGDETRDLDGEVRWRYVIGTDRKEPDKGELVVHLSRPSEEQLLVLLRLVDLAEDDQMGTVRLYGDALDALMAPGEPRRCARWLLQGRIHASDFIAVGPAAIRHFWPEVLEAEKAPKHGPTARPRSARARAR